MNINWLISFTHLTVPWLETLDKDATIYSAQLQSKYSIS